MRANLLTPILLCWLLMGGVAAAQVNVSVLINYGSAYRDQSWVPVDVLVANDGLPIEGWVELRLVSMTGSVQSPVHRVPADCPRGSRKRFRFHCYLDQSQNVEVRLIHGFAGGEASAIRRGITPIQADDFLTLILDEDVPDYGFLSSVMITKDVKRRFYRENLKNETLSFLADYPQCYQSFDLIILGSIDPNRIIPAHRERLIEYVSEGGTLVVMTGAHAGKFRGTWVEELLGATIGSPELVNGQELARSVFAEEDQAGASPTRQGSFALLTARSPEVETVGKPRVLATKRPVGRGVAVGIAVDSFSHLLQDCAGYRAMWRGLYESRTRSDTLYFRSAGDLWSQRLMHIKGIRIPSRTSVLVYLGLYFFIGIVANWLVWNKLKRREMAWVCLVVISFGFTGYAMVFGPTGEGKATQLDQLQVIHVPGTGGTADHHSLVGILTQRSSRLSAALEGEFARVSDLRTTQTRGGRPFSRNPGRGVLGGEQEIEPFLLVEQVPPRIEGLRVRAREIRCVEVQSRQPIPGHLEGAVVLDRNGLSGSLTNHSGYTIDKPLLLFDGKIYKAEATKDGFKVALPTAALDAPLTWKSLLQHVPPDAKLRDLRATIVAVLFRDEKLAGVLNSGHDHAIDLLSKRCGPCIFGWTEGPHKSTLRLDRPAEETLHGTLVVLDFRVDRRVSETVRSCPLPVRQRSGSSRPDTGWQLGRSPDKSQWRELAWRTYSTHPSDKPILVDILIPEECGNKLQGELLIDLYWTGPPGLGLEPVPSSGANSQPRFVMVEESGLDAKVHKRTYRVEEWRPCITPEKRFLEARIDLHDAGNTPPGKKKPEEMLFSVVGRLEARPDAGATGGRLPQKGEDL